MHIKTLVESQGMALLEKAGLLGPSAADAADKGPTAAIADRQ